MRHSSRLNDQSTEIQNTGDGIIVVGKSRGLMATLALLTLVVALPASAHADNWAEKMFSVRSHDFRTVGRGTKTEFSFEFTNPYREDVHISAVRTSCGCTTPTITADTVSTHETAAVVATFNTNTFIGQKAAVVTVVFDQPTYAEVQLKVNGYIRTDITFDPPEVNFGEIAPGQSQTREVTITHSGGSDWKIEDVRSHCDHLRVRLETPQKTPGMVRYRMQVRLDGDMPAGDIRERLTLISNDNSFPTTEMAIAGRIRPPLSLSPMSVPLGTIAADATTSNRLVVRGERPFEITDIVSADERFAFEVPEGKKKIHLVKMIFTGDGSIRPVSTEVRVVSDLPEPNNSATCIVTGTVK